MERESSMLADEVTIYHAKTRGPGIRVYMTLSKIFLDCLLWQQEMEPVVCDKNISIIDILVLLIIIPLPLVGMDWIILYL